MQIVHHTCEFYGNGVKYVHFLYGLEHCTAIAGLYMLQVSFLQAEPDCMFAEDIDTRHIVAY